MNFRQYLHSDYFFKFNAVALVSVALILGFFIYVFWLIRPNPMITVNLSKIMTSDRAARNNVFIIVTGENILYYDNKVCTLDELKKVFFALNRKSSVLIKVDRRASVGRVIDLWDMLRNLGIERVDVAAD